MQQLTISEIDQIRILGFRPQVVGCFLKNKRILFLYKKEHRIWQLPQGGIDNQETIEEAFKREMIEELGCDFAESYDRKTVFFGEDQIEFPANTKNSRTLKSDVGQNIFMIGKKYFFISVNSATDTIDISKTEFDDYRWVTFEEGLILCENIYQKGKKRVNLKILRILRENDLL